MTEVQILYCENCGKEHDGSYGSGRFCSAKCARGFSTKNKRAEINEKVSKTLKATRKIIYKDEYDQNPRFCPICKEKIPYEKRHLKTCGKLECQRQWLCKVQHEISNSGKRKFVECGQRS